jgi:hypothetical protein
MEQQLVAAACVIQNDIGTLLSCAALSSPPKQGGSSLVTQARASQEMFFLLLLAGKLNEAWALLDKTFLRAPEFVSFRPRLTGPARRALRSIEKYFAKGSKPICAMRNLFAFHYDARALARSLASIPDDEDIEMWLTTHAGSSRYSLGSVLAFRELQRLFTGRRQGVQKQGCDVFFGETMNVVTWFIKFFGGVMVVLLGEEKLQQRERVIVSEQEDPGLPAFPMLPLPWSETYVRAQDKAER